MSKPWLRSLAIVVASTLFVWGCSSSNPPAGGTGGSGSPRRCPCRDHRPSRRSRRLRRSSSRRSHRTCCHRCRWTHRRSLNRPWPNRPCRSTRRCSRDRPSPIPRCPGRCRLSPSLPIHRLACCWNCNPTQARSRGQGSRYRAMACSYPPPSLHSHLGAAHAPDRLFKLCAGSLRASHFREERRQMSAALFDARRSGQSGSRPDDAGARHPAPSHRSPAPAKAPGGFLQDASRARTAGCVRGHS